VRGRKRTPSTIHLLEGGVGKTHRAKSYRSGEPKPPAVIPKCPRHLDKEARAEWRRMVKELEPLGILTNLDKAIFASYCQAWSEWIAATLAVQKMGMVGPGSKGVPVINPVYKLIDASNARMIKALIEMGMSPSSRSRVTVPERKPVVSEKERFFK